MNTTSVEGNEVGIGDVVGFKCDVEQYGRIIHIESDGLGRVFLTLEAEHSFVGDYIGGQQITKVRADDCWV